MSRFSWREAPVEDVAGVLLMVGVLVTMGLGVFFRYVLNDSLTWSEELSRYGLIYMTYLGCATAVRRGTHIRVDLVDLLLPARPRRILGIVVDLVMLAFFVFLIVKTWAIMDVLRTSRSTAMEIPIGYVYFGILLGFGLASLRLVLKYRGMPTSRAG